MIIKEVVDMLDLSDLSRDDLIFHACLLTGDSPSTYEDWSVEELQELLINIS